MGYNFQTINSADPEINRIQANIFKALQSINGPFVGGNLLTGIKLVSGVPLAINHGLNRVPELWTLSDILSAANVFRISWDKNSITLQATADCTIAIWVN